MHRVTSIIATPARVAVSTRCLAASAARRAGDCIRFLFQGRRLGPGGAGECLRANFRLVTDTVRDCDGHLLSDDEHAMLDSFHVRLCLEHVQTGNEEGHIDH